MRIVQFMASEDWGGAESVFVELSNELAESHQVTALLLKGTRYQQRFSPRVNRLILRSNPTRYNPFQIYEIYRHLKDIKPDIIHTHAVKGAELVFCVNRFLRIPHLATKHNVRKGKVFNKLKWVTAVSQASGQTIHSDKTDSVEVIYNGIRPMNLADTAKFDVFTILAVGRLDRVKGFDVLIDQVRRLNFGFRLLILGEGPERKNLEKALDTAGLQKKVQLTGFRDDIPQLMKKAHLVVVSSHAEGFSKVIVEGLFYADVVVSTPVGVAIEILPPAFLTEQEMIGDKICEVYRDFIHYKKEFRRVREMRNGEFLFSSIVDKYTNIYQKMLEKG
jgi:glycosyltransferase involved in cell wall biosynthesis